MGAGILHAAVIGLARQHKPGTARFLLAPLAESSEPVAADAAATLTAHGHESTTIGQHELRKQLAALAQPTQHSQAAFTYLVLFAADAANTLAEKDDSRRTGLDDLRQLLRTGPSRGIHVLGWWRGVRRFTDDTGSSGRDDVACLVALNIQSQDVKSLLGDYSIDWHPRPNRALLFDRHESRTALIVPFTRPADRGENNPDE